MVKIGNIMGKGRKERLMVVCFLGLVNTLLRALYGESLQF